jgi:hypothetical protein
MPIPVKIVTVTMHGVTYEGMYYLQDSMVHVESSYGKKATQVGGSGPEAISKLLLAKLVWASASTD